jgi:hypothetical protein
MQRKKVYASKRFTTGYEWAKLSLSKLVNTNLYKNEKKKIQKVYALFIRKAYRNFAFNDKIQFQLQTSEIRLRTLV